MLILTARSRAHRVVQDDAVLRRALALNCARKPLKSYTVVMREDTGHLAITVERDIRASSLFLARKIGRAFAADNSLHYVTTRLGPLEI